MDPLTWAWMVVAGVIGFAMWWFGLRDANAFRRAADVLGLATDHEALTLDGAIDGCRITARRTSVDGQRVTQIVAHPEERFPAGLAFGPEGLVQTVLRTVAGGDVRTGDRKFDDAVLVQGDPALVLAILDAANRRLVRRLVEQGAVLDGGELRLSGAVRRRALPETIRTLARAARALRVTPAQIPDRLLTRVKRDPLPDVRQRAFELLLARFPDSPQTAAAIRSNLSDRDPRLRLQAARHGADEAAEATLRALATDGAVERRLREETLDVYIDRLGSGRASPLLVELLDDPTLAADAAARLARTGRAEALPALCARVGQGEIGARAEMAIAIGKLGDPREPSHEAALLPLLDEAPLQVAAAEALARVGSPRALQALLPLTEGLLTGGDVKASARRAVDAIRSRRGEGEGGGLSVVEGDPADRLGRLSVAAERSGLALTDSETES